jgi:hypothetical protein
MLLQEALYVLFDKHGRELRAAGAQLFGNDGRVLESIARVGRLDDVGSAPLALADFHAHFDPSGERVRLIAGGADAAQPLAYFEVAHGARPFVFLFHFEPEWERNAAELLLNTPSSPASTSPRGASRPRRSAATGSTTCRSAKARSGSRSATPAATACRPR